MPDLARVRPAEVWERAAAAVRGWSTWTYALVAAGVLATALAIDVGVLSRVPVDALAGSWRVLVAVALVGAAAWVVADDRAAATGRVRMVLLYGLAVLGGVLVGLLAAPAWELVVETWAAGLLVVRPRFESGEATDVQRGTTS